MAMTMDDYRNEVRECLLAYASKSLQYDPGLSAELIMDNAFIEDSVTGNGSGSFTFNARKAEENLSDLIWSDGLLGVFQDYGYDSIPIERGAEFIDVIIRCYLLGEFTAEIESLLEKRHLAE